MVLYHTMNTGWVVGSRGPRISGGVGANPKRGRIFAQNRMKMKTNGLRGHTYLTPPIFATCEHTQRWWGHANPTCYHRIHLNFLLSQTVGMLKHRARAPRTCLCWLQPHRTIWWKFHYQIFQFSDVSAPIESLTHQSKWTISTVHPVHLSSSTSFWHKSRVSDHCL